MSVLVAHPVRQHSHRLAAALESRGSLHSYWTLLPDRRAMSWLPRAWDGLLPSAVFRHALEGVAPDRVHVLYGPLLLQKYGGRLSGDMARDRGEWAAWTLFDRWVARNLARLRPAVVVGYEMSCVRIFTEARRLGIACVLDAAAVHYTMQDRLLEHCARSAATRAGTALRARKRREIELADRIVCPSQLARASYVDAGVESERIVVNLPGCDIAMFSAHAAGAVCGSPRFVFVGQPVPHKGMDLLLSALQRLRQEHPGVELHVVGDPRPLAALARRPAVVLHGKLSHPQLARLLGGMDCLVLPSRLDSFGMVVVEALAAGVPVIVSDGAGAREVVVHGVNGWIVRAGDEQALLQRMLDCCREIDRVRAMRAACQASAAEYDWSRYAARTVALLESLQPGEGEPMCVQGGPP